MKNLINDNGSINVHESFSVPNSDLEMKVIGTKNLDGNGWKESVFNTTDTIKTLSTGKITEMNRKDLQNLKPYINDTIKGLPETNIKPSTTDPSRSQFGLSFNGSKDR